MDDDHDSYGEGSWKSGTSSEGEISGSDSLNSEDFEDNEENEDNENNEEMAVDVDDITSEKSDTAGTPNRQNDASRGTSPSTQHQVKSVEPCANCGVTNEKWWRRRPNGERLCSRCMKYELRNKKPRPLHLEKSISKKRELFVSLDGNDW
jgi:hypothetical protein